MRDEFTKTLQVESGALGDKKAFEVGVGFDERFPGWCAHEEGPKKFDTFESGERGVEGFECGVVQLAAEIEPEGGQVGVEVDQTFQSRRRKV